MKLQKQVLYAIDAVGIITGAQAKKYDASVPTSEIADHLGISADFTRNLLSILVRSNVLVSCRGPSGGYRLARPPEAIKISEIIMALAPKEIESLNENMLHTDSLLGQEICGELWDKTNRVFEKTITEFVTPAKAGICVPSL